MPGYPPEFNVRAFRAAAVPLLPDCCSRGWRASRQSCRRLRAQDGPGQLAAPGVVTVHIAGAGLDLKVFPVDMLVAAKFYSDRPQDLHDIAAMLERGIFEPDEVHRLISSIDPEGAADFATLIQELRRPRRRRPPPRRK